MKKRLRWLNATSSKLARETLGPATSTVLVALGKGILVRRSQLRVLIWYLVPFLMTVEIGQACTCMAPATVAEAYEKSSAVFKGKVIKIYQPFLDFVGITRTGNHRVKFEIIRQWKGSQSKYIVVTTRPTGEACGFAFQEGKEYLVYVAPGLPGIDTGICTGTKPLTGAESELEQLDQMVKNR